MFCDFRCGFTEMEIDLFFAKFEIPKDRPITQEEMRSKLLTNFNLQPDAGNDLSYYFLLHFKELRHYHGLLTL